MIRVAREGLPAFPPRDLRRFNWAAIVSSYGEKKVDIGELKGEWEFPSAL
jgi:hypothetical protein